MESTYGVEDLPMTNLVQSVLCKLQPSCSMRLWTDVDRCRTIALLLSFYSSQESSVLDGLSFSLSVLTKKLAARWFVSSVSPFLLNWEMTDYPVGCIEY